MPTRTGTPAPAHPHRRARGSNKTQAREQGSVRVAGGSLSGPTALSTGGTASPGPVDAAFVRSAGESAICQLCHRDAPRAAAAGQCHQQQSREGGTSSVVKAVARHRGVWTVTLCSGGEGEWAASAGTEQQSEHRAQQQRLGDDSKAGSSRGAGAQRCLHQSGSQSTGVQARSWRASSGGGRGQKSGRDSSRAGGVSRSSSRARNRRGAHRGGDGRFQRKRTPQSFVTRTIAREFYE